MKTAFLSLPASFEAGGISYRHYYAPGPYRPKRAGGPSSGFYIAFASPAGRLVEVENVNTPGRRSVWVDGVRVYEVIKDTKEIDHAGLRALVETALWAAEAASRSHTADVAEAEAAKKRAHLEGL